METLLHERDQSVFYSFTSSIHLILEIMLLNTYASIFLSGAFRYMSSSLLKIASEHSSVVAVVGKGHMNGIKKHWKQSILVRCTISLGLYVISTNLMSIEILLSFFQTSAISGERSAGSSFREIHFHHQSSHLLRGRCCWGGHRNWNLPWMQEVGIHRSMNSHRKLSRYQLFSGPSESTSKMMNHHRSTI